MQLVANWSRIRYNNRIACNGALTFKEMLLKELLSIAKWNFGIAKKSIFINLKYLYYNKIDILPV